MKRGRTTSLCRIVAGVFQPCVILLLGGVARKEWLTPLQMKLVIFGTFLFFSADLIARITGRKPQPEASNALENAEKAVTAVSMIASIIIFIRIFY